MKDHDGMTARHGLCFRSCDYSAFTSSVSVFHFCFHASPLSTMMTLRSFVMLAFSVNASAFLAPMGTRPIPSTASVHNKYSNGLYRLQSAGSSENDFLDQKSGFGWKNHKVVMSHLLGASILLSSGWTSPTIAMAADSGLVVPEDVTVLNHEYSDPLHPLCQRTIQVDQDGKTFHYSGTGVGSKDDPVLRGCSAGEIKKYGSRTGSFDGQIIMPGLRLSVGDGVHEGKWEPANSVTTPSSLKYKSVDGIRWNDGNKWMVKGEVPKPLATVIGEWFFLAYIGFSTLAGVKGVVDKIQEKKNRAAS